MASHVDDLTINFEEDGIQVVKQLDKEILSKGAWATVLFRYQEWDRRKQEYGADKFTIRRYRKMNDEYRQQTKFNISSIDQAKKIIDTLTRWIDQKQDAQE
ncbi:MAG: hypothetical protein ACOC4C_03080 [Fibrobacterota bacterium]